MNGDFPEELLSEIDGLEGWIEPSNIPDGLPSVAEFTPELLPEALRDWVSDISDRMQCPPDFPAVAAMVSVSSVIGRKACIKPKRFDDWKVVPNLWGAIVGRPGVMKSPALSEAMKPLHNMQREASFQFKEDMKRYEVEGKLTELEKKSNEKKASDLIRKGRREEAEQLLIDAASSENDAPILKRFIVTDATVEALGEIMTEAPGGIMVYRDELHGQLKSLDKEGQEGARAFYLQAYDGNQPYTFDRIMRGKNLHIPALCLSILGGIQPGKIQSYVREALKGGAGDDGLLQRFGMIVWPDINGTWVNVDRSPDDEAKKQAHSVFERLSDFSFSQDDKGRDVPVEFRFTDEAQEIFESWREDLEHILRGDSLHPAMESHLAKYRKLVPALALTCSLCDAEDEVSKKSILRALAWSQYLRTHAERVYSAGIFPATDSAKALLKKIREGKVLDNFKPADVYLKGWTSLNSPELTRDALKMLVDLNYLQRVETRSVGGGRPAVTYRINPLFIRGF